MGCVRYRSRCTESANSTPGKVIFGGGKPRYVSRTYKATSRRTPLCIRLVQKAVHGNRYTSTIKLQNKTSVVSGPTGVRGEHGLSAKRQDAFINNGVDIERIKQLLWLARTAKYDLYTKQYLFSLSLRVPSTESIWKCELYRYLQTRQVVFVPLAKKH